MLGLQRFLGGISSQYMRAYGFCTTTRAATRLTRRKLTADAAVSATELDVSIRKPKNSIVAAAFDSLKEPTPALISADTVDEPIPLKSSNDFEKRISDAKTVNALLSLMDSSGSISRKYALQIVSILAEWSASNRVKLAEFENDTRFIRICRVLGRNVTENHLQTSISRTNSKDKRRMDIFRADDLNTVLGVAGDDEAAKLIANIKLPQMVKVMTTLGHRKRRSTTLLRSLAFNISSSTEHLNLKQCADVLYAMATLNFLDSVLAAKICADIHVGLPKMNEKSAVIGSILTSLGILKYRDLDIMESLTQWSLRNCDVCRPQDLNALFITSAVLNFKSAIINDVCAMLKDNIVKEDFPNQREWLNYVWALAVLGVVKNVHLESVLSEGFLKELQGHKVDFSPTVKMKLLNLNGFAQLMMADYQGPVLSQESPVFTVPLAHSQGKQALLNCMLDTLKNLLPSSNHVKSMQDSNMGFVIDAVCMFDNKRNPLVFDSNSSNAIKVALMVVDFHDTCNGAHRSLSGRTKIHFDLLEKRGYRILPIMHNEFTIGDKLLKRVQYLEKKFKMATTN